MTSEETLLFNSLTDQIGILTNTVSSQIEVIKKLGDNNEELNNRLKELQSQIAWFQRQYFGRKSEKMAPLDPNQLDLQFDGTNFNDINKEIEEASTQARKQITKKDTSEKDKKPRRNRKMLENLPVIQ